MKISKTMKIIHLYVKRTDKSGYYSTVAALVADNTPEKLGANEDAIYNFARGKKSWTLENEKVVISKATVFGMREVMLAKIVPLLFVAKIPFDFNEAGYTIEEMHLDYKKGFIVEGQKRFDSMEEVVSFFADRMGGSSV